MKTKPIIGIIPTLHFTSEEENNLTLEEYLEGN